VAVGVYPLATLVERRLVDLAFQKIAGRGFGRIRSMDTTCIKVHAHGANPQGGQEAQVMGRTKGGLNTKLALIVESLGRPLAMRLAPGNRHDLKVCHGLWRELCGGWLIAERPFDSDDLRAAFAAHGILGKIYVLTVDVKESELLVIEVVDSDRYQKIAFQVLCYSKSECPFASWVFANDGYLGHDASMRKDWSVIALLISRGHSCPPSSFSLSHQIR